RKVPVAEADGQSGQYSAGWTECPRAEGHPGIMPRALPLVRLSVRYLLASLAAGAGWIAGIQRHASLLTPYGHLNGRARPRGRTAVAGHGAPRPVADSSPSAGGRRPAPRARAAGSPARGHRPPT